MNLILPKKRKLNETETVALPMVKCSFCGNMTSNGMKQTRLDMTKKGDLKIVNGVKMYKPPVMKKIDYYMCLECVKRGTRWKGQRP